MGSEKKSEPPVPTTPKETPPPPAPVKRADPSRREYEDDSPRMYT